MDFLTVNSLGGKSYQLEIPPEGLNIGRSSSNGLVLEDPGVSRSHARIGKTEEGYFIFDAGGKNGTYLNDKRIATACPLKNGDTIRVGSTILTFNGATTNQVEFVDSPMPAGPTTILKVREAVSSAPGVRYTTTDTDAVQAVLPVTNLSSGFMASPALSIIFEADQELVFHRPLGQILETIVDLVGKAVPFDRGLLMLLENGHPVPKVIRVPPGQEGRTISISQTIADRVILRRESVLTADALADERFREGHSVVAQQIRSAMCVPLWNNSEVIGLIYIDSRRHAGLFNEDHLRLLSHLANVAAVKIENVKLFEQRVEAERTEQELKKAWEIQKILLPSSSPPMPGYLLHGTSDPCRVVGGDLFDYIELPGGRLTIALGDVAGKGYPAALLMCFFQAALRALCDLDLPLEETMERLNKVLSRRFPDNRYVTFFCGVLDPASHTLTYVNAGHCPPLLIGSAGVCRALPASGGPLGMFEKGTYEARVVNIEPGEVLVCYSDGVTDSCNPAGEDFGERKLMDLLERSASGAPTEIIDRIKAEIDTYHAGVSAEDDLTLVVLKRAA